MAVRLQFMALVPFSEDTYMLMACSTTLPAPPSNTVNFSQPCAVVLLQFMALVPFSELTNIPLLPFSVITLPIGTVVGLEVDENWIQFKLKPPTGTNKRRVCSPAARVAVAVTVVQFCQPPVAGTEVVASMAVSLLSWMLPPPFWLATRYWIVYSPAVWTFTL